MQPRLSRKPTKLRPYSFIICLFLVSCGGGSGGDTNIFTSAKCKSGASGTINLSSCVKAGSFTYYEENATTIQQTLRYIYPHDLNNDGVDEIIFAGLETQPNSGVNYSNTSIHIFGWVNNALTEITSDWLPGDSNKVEAVGDIAFGDFDNNGHIDLYLSANADMDDNEDYVVNAYALMNNGTSLTKINLGENSWEHGSAAGDINNDGYDDVVVASYQNPAVFFLGGESGLSKHVVNAATAQELGFNDYSSNGSDIAIGNFLNNGSNILAVVDSAVGGNGNNLVVAVENAESTVVGFDHYSDLPAPSLGENSHDIRVRGFDFDSDTLTDILIFARENWDGTKWPTNSRLQFLRNTGDGVFSDVTTSILLEYDTNSNIGYVPIFKDFNNDGLTDIFMNDAEFNNTTNSTTILLQQSNGTFVDTARAELSSLVDNGGMATIAKGPNNEFYLIIDSSSVTNNKQLTHVYFSKISWP